MRPLRYTERAEADLLAAHGYAAEMWGKAVADRYMGAMQMACGMLRHFIELGREVEGYRRIRHERHAIFYRVLEDDSILIVRVLHERQLASKHL